MNTFVMIVGILLGILLVGVLAAVIYLMASPMPAVRLLRGKLEDDLSYPPEYEKAKKRMEIRKDLVYPSAYAQNTFDLYLPKADGWDVAERPLVLWVHGGAFVAGDKCGTQNWGVMLAAQGYAVASINYVWAPEEAYPAQIRQVAEALRAVEQMAEAEQIDMDRVVIAGDSAGAYIAIQFALCHTNPVLAERLGVVSPLKAEALKAALLYCGPYDIERFMQLEQRMLKFMVSRIGWSFLGKKNWRKSPLADTISPMKFVTEQSVPCYITDGNNVSFETHGRSLGEALRAHGVEVQERYFPIEEGLVNHEYQMSLDSDNAKLCFADTLSFLREHMV